MGVPVPASPGASACERGLEPKGWGEIQLFLKIQQRGKCAEGERLFKLTYSISPGINEKFPVDSSGLQT